MVNELRVSGGWAPLAAAGCLALAGEPAGGAPGPTASFPMDQLGKARTLYNEGRYEAAIEAAAKAQQEPLQRDAATLILGRAGLERYRYTADPGDLTRAREALRSVDAGKLTPRDRTDLLIGMGEALFFDEAYRPAADLFESMLNGEAELTPTARDQVLDWWATAIDRYVRILPAAERAAAYDHLIDAHGRRAAARQRVGRGGLLAGGGGFCARAGRAGVARGDLRLGARAADRRPRRGAAARPRSAGAGSDHPRARPPAADRRHARRPNRRRRACSPSGSW